jgi:hypothetical protein
LFGIRGAAQAVGGVRFSAKRPRRRTTAEHCNVENEDRPNRSNTHILARQAAVSASVVEDRRTAKVRCSGEASPALAP